MDDDFPPMPTSLYYNPDENKDAFSIKWRRLKDIIVDDKEIDVPWAVFRMPQPSDISQGKKQVFLSPVVFTGCFSRCFG